jgi:hypothetical protein
MRWSSMAFFRKDKEKERYYLLPGMGGRSYRRKQRWMLRWSILAGICTSAIIAGLLYWISNR